MDAKPQTDLLSSPDDAAAGVRQEPGLMSILVLNPSIVIGGLLLAAIVLIIAVIAALNRDQIAAVGAAVLAVVAVHNALGLGIAFGLARALRFEEIECRTLAIEVGMQNSGLGVVLAHQYFSTLAALPGAVFSIWHNLSGSLLASWWSRSPTAEA